MKMKRKKKYFVVVISKKTVVVCCFPPVFLFPFVFLVSVFLFFLVLLNGLYVCTGYAGMIHNVTVCKRRVQKKNPSHTISKTCTRTCSLPDAGAFQRKHNNETANTPRNKL